MADYIPRNKDDQPSNRYSELEEMWTELYDDVPYPGYTQGLYDSLRAVKTQNKIPEGYLSGVANQGVTRPTAERYGSEPMLNANEQAIAHREKARQAGINNVPQTPAVSTAQGISKGDVRTMPSASMIKDRGLSPEQIAINKAAFQKTHPQYNIKNPDAYGAERSTPLSRGYNQAGYFNANNMNDLNMRNAAMGLINMSDTAEVNRMGLGSKAEPDTRRQDYINRVANKPLPRRDMRGNTYTSGVTGRQVPNYAKQNVEQNRQAELIANQLQHRTNQASQLTQYDEQPDYTPAPAPTPVKRKPQENSNGFFNV